MRRPCMQVFSFSTKEPMQRLHVLVNKDTYASCRRSTDIFMKKFHTHDLASMRKVDNDRSTAKMGGESGLTGRANFCFAEN